MMAQAFRNGQLGILAAMQAVDPGKSSGSLEREYVVM
jgi:hypothetical protein